MTTPSPITIGIDFGTTNTVVAVTDAEGRAQLTTFGADGSTFRSALAFQFHPSQDGQPPERVVEVARMLAGSTSATSLAHAQELLEQAA